jgi:hypothetical protein
MARRKTIDSSKARGEANTPAAPEAETAGRPAAEAGPAVAAIAGTDAAGESANGGSGDPAAPTAAVPPAPDAARAAPRLMVTALVDRRRRAGLAFGRHETELDPEELGEAAFRALVLDRLLKVEIVFRSDRRIRLTTFPPTDADQARIAELSAEAEGDEGQGTGDGVTGDAG